MLIGVVVICPARVRGVHCLEVNGEMLDGEMLDCKMLDGEVLDRWNGYGSGKGKNILALMDIGRQLNGI